MSLKNVQKFLKNEKKAIEKFKNTVKTKRKGKPGEFTYDIWNEWYEHFQRISAFNSAIGKNNKLTLCNSLAEENKGLAELINNLSKKIKKTKGKESKRHLIFIKAGLCSTYYANQKILKELGQCKISGVERKCLSLDTTKKPDCKS